MAKNPGDLLQSPNLKVGPAEYHINDLNGKLHAYLGQMPFRLMTRVEPKAGRETHFIKEVIPIPPEFGLIIGDAVHNLRSSLDMLMFAMIGGQAARPENIQFPFARRADTLVSTMKNRETEIAGEKVVAEIEALKPYPGGNEWLSAVHSLDIADKHKLIIPAASSAIMSSVEFARMAPGITGYESVDIIFHQRTSIVSLRAGSRAMRRANRSNIRSREYERELQPLFEIILDEGQALSGKPVVPVLVALVGEVRSTLSKIAAAFCS